jgi:hypothetical protein
MGAWVVYHSVYARICSGRSDSRCCSGGMLTAAERTGVLLVVLENLCGYGPAEGKAGPPRGEGEGS